MQNTAPTVSKKNFTQISKFKFLKKMDSSSPEPPQSLRKRKSRKNEEEEEEEEVMKSPSKRVRTLLQKAIKTTTTCGGRKQSVSRIRRRSFEYCERSWSYGYSYGNALFQIKQVSSLKIDIGSVHQGFEFSS